MKDINTSPGHITSELCLISGRAESGMAETSGETTTQIEHNSCSVSVKKCSCILELRITLNHVAITYQFLSLFKKYSGMPDNQMSYCKKEWENNCVLSDPANRQAQINLCLL